jgi:hypothetical protein
MIVVTAHPGRTDSRGGHYDRSTGEYHYHHGYSAHQHYDIDGDGKKDCPYDFDDKTNHSSNSSQGNNNRYDYEENQTTTTNAEQVEKRITFWDITKSILIIIVVTLIIILAGSISFIPLVSYFTMNLIECLFKLIFKKELSTSAYEKVMIGIYVFLFGLIIFLVSKEVLTIFDII